MLHLCHMCVGDIFLQLFTSTTLLVMTWSTPFDWIKRSFAHGKQAVLIHLLKDLGHVFSSMWLDSDACLDSLPSFSSHPLSVSLPLSVCLPSSLCTECYLSLELVHVCCLIALQQLPQSRICAAGERCEPSTHCLENWKTLWYLAEYQSEWNIIFAQGQWPHLDNILSNFNPLHFSLLPQQFPYPSYRTDFYFLILAIFLPFVVMITLIYSAAMFVKVSDCLQYSS